MLDDILTQAATSTLLLFELFATNFHDNGSLSCCLWLQPQQKRGQTIRLFLVPNSNKKSMETNREIIEFKQITTAGAITAAVTEKVWGEYVSVVCQILSLASKAKCKDETNIG